MLVFIVALFFVTLSFVLGCDAAENDNDTGLNPACNYAGVCFAVFTPFGSTQVCQCCAPSQIDSHNICEGWSCDKNNPTFECYRFEGSDCTTFTK